jgi:pimeloyl-ACP methyl ester carboxylesterase
MALLAEHLPGATAVHEVDGAWHSPPVTHPDQVNDVLVRFLTSEEVLHSAAV